MDIIRAYVYPGIEEVIAGTKRIIEPLETYWIGKDLNSGKVNKSVFRHNYVSYN